MTNPDTSQPKRPFFTGRQVTTMVVTLLAAVVLAPTTVWAATQFSNVAITDATTGNTAKVNAGGRLLVAGATRQEVPLHPWHWWGQTGASAQTLHTSSTAIALTTATFFTEAGGAQDYGLYAQQFCGGTPTGARDTLEAGRVQQNDTIVVTFPSPLVVAAPSCATPSVSIELDPSDQYPVWVSLVGYDT